MLPSEQSCFAEHSPVTDPGARADLLADPPGDFAGVLRWVHNVVLHMYYGAELAPALAPARAEDRRFRTIQGILERIAGIDPRPLSVERPEDQRFSGNCRDYALLTCALLRHQGLPARLRCGFSGYFTQGLWEDHWLCEAWDAGQERWRLLDAQLDAERLARHAIAFDPCDVPRDLFLTAGKAWIACQDGELKAETFGLSYIGMTGEWFMAGNLLRDLAALNGMEMQPWDYWGLSREIGEAMRVPETALPLLREIAEAIAPESVDLLRIRDLSARPELRVPSHVLAYPYGAPEEIPAIA